MTDTNTHSLRKGALGPLAIAFFVISAAGPLVAMAGGIPIAMLLGNGPGISAMFLLASLILLAFSAGYTAMARHVRNAGAFYAFAARGLGGVAAGATGLIALLSYNALQIGLYGLFGAAAKGLIEPFTQTDLPWWLYSFAALLVVAFFGYRQVDLSARVLGVLVACEYLVVLILDGVIVATGGDAGLSAAPFAPAAVLTGAPIIGLMLCFSAFVGFEATTIYSEEAHNPERTVPLATYFSVILIGGFYTLSTWAVVNGAGVESLLPTLQSYPDPTALLFNLSDRYAGPELSLAMRILFVTSVFASILAFHNAVARYFFAMGREKILPRWLSNTHKRFASPYAGSLTQSILAAICVAIAVITNADPVLVLFTIPSAIATLGIILLMAITSLAAIRFLSAQAQKPLIAIALSIVACIALFGVAGLATFRFDALAGAKTPLITLLPLSLLIAGVIGGVLAARLRSTDPEQYKKLGAGAA